MPWKRRVRTGSGIRIRRFRKRFPYSGQRRRMAGFPSENISVEKARALLCSPKLSRNAIRSRSEKRRVFLRATNPVRGVLREIFGIRGVPYADGWHRDAGRSRGRRNFACGLSILIYGNRISKCPFSSESVPNPPKDIGNRVVPFPAFASVPTAWTKAGLDGSNESGTFP
ncbi:MAG: hypothetical protein QG650_725 [Patescibacteria group bacterium]|nr:hypothetical protein [Patescibacteria group bacterium]